MRYGVIITCNSNDSFLTSKFLRRFTIKRAVCSSELNTLVNESETKKKKNSLSGQLYCFIHFLVYYASHSFYGCPNEHLYKIT